jgi:hypothetical protein
MGGGASSSRSKPAVSATARRRSSGKIAPARNQNARYEDDQRAPAKGGKVSPARTTREASYKAPPQPQAPAPAPAPAPPPALKVPSLSVAAASKSPPVATGGAGLPPIDRRALLQRSVTSPTARTTALLRQGSMGSDDGNGSGNGSPLSRSLRPRPTSSDWEHHPVIIGPAKSINTSPSPSPSPSPATDSLAKRRRRSLDTKPELGTTPRDLGATGGGTTPREGGFGGVTARTPPREVEMEALAESFWNKIIAYAISAADGESVLVSETRKVGIGPDKEAELLAAVRRQKEAMMLKEGNTPRRRASGVRTVPLL